MDGLTRYTLGKSYRLPSSFIAEKDNGLLAETQNKNNTTLSRRVSNHVNNEFTGQARKIWNGIPVEFQEQLIANVWCSSCGMTTITNFKARVEAGDLLLNGECVKCGQPVARLIENE
ncbi:MAG: hypothetical protein AAF485_13810 [Chloroflexota bacterium]